MHLPILFVDDEDAVLRTIQRTLESSGVEWNVRYAPSSEKALELLTREPVAAVVADRRMPPGDGSRLLGEVCDRWPDALRIIMSAPADREVSLEACREAHQFLAKPFTVARLEETLGRAALMRGLMENDTLVGLVRGVRKLPSMPSLYFQLLQELESPDSSLRTIGDIIARDMALTVKVLQVINSPLFRLSQPVTSPQQAATLLGVNLLKSVILYVQVFSSGREKSGPFTLQALWKHSMGVASLARAIASDLTDSRETQEDTFIAGLLHDVGKLVLMELPDHFARLESMGGGSGPGGLPAEYVILGTSHSEVGAYLLGLWGLPDAIVEGVAFHHRPGRHHLPQNVVLASVHTADALWYADPDPSVPVEGLDECVLPAFGQEERLERWRVLACAIRSGEGPQDVS